MDKLRLYLNQLSTREQHRFALSAGTTIGYLRKALSIGQKIGEGLCIRIQHASAGEVLAEDLRPDIPWHVIRGSAPGPSSGGETAKDSGSTA